MMPKDTTKYSRQHMMCLHTIYKRTAKSAATVASAMVELVRTVGGQLYVLPIASLQLAEDEWRDGIGGHCSARNGRACQQELPLALPH
jgi:hypothetical protein